MPNYENVRLDVHLPAALCLADAVDAVDVEADEEALLADAAHGVLLRLGDFGARGLRGAVGAEAGGGAGSVYAHAAELDVEVGVERVEGVSDEGGRAEVQWEAWRDEMWDHVGLGRTDARDVPSTCTVRGKGGGKGVGERYSRRMLGL